MNSLPDIYHSPRSESSDSYYSSLEDLPLCDLCRTRMRRLEHEIEELISDIDSCPYCFSHDIDMSDISSNSNMWDADEEDSDSTEYRNAILGIDNNMSDISSFNSFGSDIMQDLSNQIHGQIPELIGDVNAQETLNFEAGSIEPSIYETRVHEPTNYEADIQQSLNYEANDHQAEEDPIEDHEFDEISFYSDYTDIPRYPERSTRSDIDSYYETRLRSRFWTKRRNSIRTRRGI